MFALLLACEQAHLFGRGSATESWQEEPRFAGSQFSSEPAPRLIYYKKLNQLQTGTIPEKSNLNQVDIKIVHIISSYGNSLFF